LASLTGAKSAGVIGARQLRRIRHPHGSDSTSEPTPPKGGSDDPLRGSFARTRKGGVEDLRVPLTGPFGTGPREGRSESIRDYDKNLL